MAESDERLPQDQLSELFKEWWDIYEPIKSLIYAQGRDKEKAELLEKLSRARNLQWGICYELGKLIEPEDEEES